MSIYLYNGIPGSGKTTKLASISLYRLFRNKKYYEKSGIRRLLVSNMKFSEIVEKEYMGFIQYWTDPSELVKLRDVDVIWDEVATYLDSTQWANVPLELKRFLQLHRHYGIDIFGSTQDFAMVDISMRRLVKQAFVCRKLFGSRDKSATMAPVLNPWGMIAIREIDSSTFSKEKEEYRFIGFPDWLFITKKLTSAFDTTQELKPGKYPPLRHIIRHCSEPGCEYCRITHV